MADDTVVDAGVDAGKSTRRRFLTRGAITAAVAAAGATAIADPAGAANGGPILIGALNSGTASTQLVATPPADSLVSSSTYFASHDPFAAGTPGQAAIEGQGIGTSTHGVRGRGFGASSVGVYGGASNGNFAVGVRGEALPPTPGFAGSNAAGVGVEGISGQVNGFGVKASATQGAAILLVDAAPGLTMPPTSGFWFNGSLVNSSAQLWYCYSGGDATESKWQRLSSTFVPLPAPVRIYDSRAGTPNQAPNVQGALTFTAAPPTAAAREINCSNTAASAAAVAAPVGATALLLNLAVVSISGVGALSVYRHGAAQPDTASINWSAGGQVLSNAVTTACDANRHVDIAIVAGAGASTHFIVDLVGYYL